MTDKRENRKGIMMNILSAPIVVPRVLAGMCGAIFLIGGLYSLGSQDSVDFKNNLITYFGGIVALILAAIVYHLRGRRPSAWIVVVLFTAGSMVAQFVDFLTIPGGGQLLFNYKVGGCGIGGGLWDGIAFGILSYAFFPKRTA